MMKTRAIKFDVQNVISDKIIGTGYNTTVNPYQSHGEKDVWVSKCIEVDNIDKLLQIMEEIVLSFSCDHENFNSIKGYCVVPTEKNNFKVYVKLQLMHENISSLCNKKQRVPEQEIVKILHSLVSGLEYLHKKEISHQNVKPTNIFVNNNGEAKLADLSSEGYFDRRDRLNAQGDTSEIVYLSPEILNDSLDPKGLDLYKADIWSLGRCLLDLLLCSSEGDVLKGEGGLGEAFSEIQKVYSHEFVSLLQEILSSEPIKRRTAHEIKNIIETKFLMKNEYQNSPGRDQQEKSFGTEISNRFKNKPQSNDLNEIEKKPWSAVLKEWQKKWSWHFKLKSEKPQQLEVSKTWSETSGQILKELTEDIVALSTENELPDLNDLQILLSNCSTITDEGWKRLSVALQKNLPTLEHLTLSLQQCLLLTDEGIDYFAENICERLVNLQTFGLVFSGCHGRFYGYNYLKISDRGIQNLLEKLSKNLKFLSSLRLCFKGCDKLSDTGVILIADAISDRLPNLKKLDLDFSRCPKITEISLSHLASKIGQKLKSLENLSLHYSWCAHMSDKEVTFLALNISNHLKNLTQLKLEFDGCTEITDEGVNHLVTNIGQYLKNIDHLYLSFTGCSKISDRAVVHIVAELGQTLKSLQQIYISFYQTRVTDDGRASLRKTFCAPLKAEIK